MFGMFYRMFARRMWWEEFQRNNMTEARKWLWRSL